MSATPGRPLRLLELPVMHGKLDSDALTIGVCERQDPEFILEQAISKGVSHIVQRDGLAYDSEIELAKVLLENPRLFFQYPVASVLLPQNISGASEASLTKIAITCTSRAEWVEVTERITEKMTTLTNAGVLSDITMIVGELMSNALIHGPTKQYGLLESDSPAELQPAHVPTSGKPSIISIGHDSDRIVVCCQDAYGSLHVKALLERIRRCVAFGIAPMINTGPGGAGIGTFMLFNAAASICIAVEQGVRTVICVTLPIRGGKTKREGIPKNLHVYFSKVDGSDV